jgi:hypothetical protein
MFTHHVHIIIVRHLVALDLCKSCNIYTVCIFSQAMYTGGISFPAKLALTLMLNGA